MAGQRSDSQSDESFEYMLLERDPDLYRTVFSGPSQISPWIDPSVLTLQHRIGRGPFGDVWIATHHQRTEDHDRYHEVAVKMLHPIREDQLQAFSVRFDEIFSKCQGLSNVCFLHGISTQNGRICIAMKFYEGSIGDKMARLKGGRIPLSDVLRYGADLARGIIDLHSRGILILNLKPCNFLLDEHDHAVLGDFGIPSLLFGLSLPNPDLIQRLGTPNYMAPEQWQPSIRGPISYETDSWGFAWSILEMLSGIQPWRGKSPDEVYQLVVLKKEKPIFPYNLPPAIENVLSGCFEYDFRDRPQMTDILDAFERMVSPALPSRTNWSFFKDKLQVGDKVRSRKLKNTCSPTTMEVPDGTIVGMEDNGERDGYILVRIHGLHDPLKVRSSTVERVTYGFAAGDWVRLREDEKKRSQVGILHSIDRSGTVYVGLIGVDTLWKGEYSDLQMAEAYCVGQFVRLKANISSPQFEWQRKRGGGLATGRISQILPNGCLFIKFPGKFNLGEVCSCLADPSEVEVVSFDKCEGIVKKYEHLEDFHWAVRPLFIAVGFFTALKLGIFVGKGIARPRSRKVASVSDQSDHQQLQQQEVQNNANAAWLPPTVANMLFRDGPTLSG
ncbi:protein KINASE OF THE OUTER CHLOROPLAST MEMBRANE 1 isoform X2 [Oryza sativa Japonica Group]|uniref:protein KINASE OF THE OUTER CHLOROPLAST MEMBRANE 1 isoform X2 n=1 Tax=Oryza sativa subsp. japonica TaxID=39947 RepID=UPI0007754E82|nr:E3 ubiquitin-protein ligase KEG isoform X2 [Oryza sativa Japonica Group]